MAVFQFDYGTTGLELYGFLRTWGTGLIWNGSAFVAFAGVDWTNYDLTMTEDTGTGTYFGTWPVVDAGNYAFTFYRRLGGTPASGDTLVGSTSQYGPFYYAGTSPPPPPGTVATGAPFEFTPPAPFESHLSGGSGYLNTGETRLFTMDFDTQNELFLNSATAISTGTVLSSNNTGLAVISSSFNRTELGAYLTAVTAGNYEVTYTVSLNDTGGTVIERTAAVTVYA